MLLLLLFMLMMMLFLIIAASLVTVAVVVVHGFAAFFWLEISIALSSNFWCGTEFFFFTIRKVTKAASNAETTTVAMTIPAMAPGDSPSRNGEESKGEMLSFVKNGQ